MARIVVGGRPSTVMLRDCQTGGENDRLDAGAYPGSRRRLRHSKSVVGPETPSNKKRLLVAGPFHHPETKRVLGVAFEMVCIALRTGDCDDGVYRAIATKLIALAKAGERSPDMLCEQALKDIVGRARGGRNEAEVQEAG